MKTGAKSFKARFTAVGVVAVSLLAGVTSLVTLGATPLNAGATATGGVYTAVSPTRVADTRTGSGYQDAGSHLGSGVSDVINLASSVPSTATAVVLNVTAVNATANTYISVYPNGGTNYTSFSNVNVYAGVTQPNLVIVPLGTSQSVDVYNYAGTVDFVADLEGYFSPAGSGGAGHFNPLTPARITDTRSGSGQANAGHTLSGGTTLTVPVLGQGGVPSSGVSAVELNVTATDTTAPSYFTVYPTGSSQPTASNLNWLPGETIPNRVIVPVGSNGDVSIFNFAGNADAVVDVDGWFSDASGAASAGDLYNSVAPARISDTRPGSNYPNGGGTLGSGATEQVQVAGAGGIPAETSGTPITAAVLNVTVASDTAPSYLTVYPAGSPRPLASDLNFFANFIVANADLAQLSSSGAISVYNFAGNTDVLVDVFGYFTPAEINGYVSAVGATPTSVVANGTSTSTVEAQVENNGVGVVGDVVNYSENPSVTGACGALSPSSATTGTNGITPASTYIASTTAGTCTITASEVTGGTSATTVITQTAPANTYSVVDSATPSAVTITTGTSNVAAAVSQNGVGLTGQTVTFTETASTTGSCGGLASPTEVTTTGGATPNDAYTASGVVGTCTITASTTVTPDTGTTVISQQPAASTHAVAILAQPATLPANSSATSVIEVAVDNNGTPLGGDTVNFTETPSVAGACGGLSSSTTSTISSGSSLGETPPITYTASNTAGVCTITATETAGGAVAGTAITQLSVANHVVEVTATPQSVTTGGSSVVAAAVSSNGVGVSGDNVTFTEAPSVAGSCGSLTPLTAVTGVDGATPNLAYVASGTVGLCTITATEAGQNAAGTVVIAQTAPAATNLAITANPSSLSLVSTTSTITVTTTGAGNAAVPNQAISFTLVGSGLLAPCGSLSSNSGVTNSSGVLVVTYTAPAIVGTLGSCSITARDSSVSPNVSNSTSISELLEL